MPSDVEKQKIPRLQPGEICPCKRRQCPRWGDCNACWRHHHLPGKKLPTTCERQKAKAERSTTTSK